MRSASVPAAPPRPISPVTRLKGDHLKLPLIVAASTVVFPVITGSTGRERIYDGYPDVRLEMIASHTFDGRLQLLEYVPTVLTEPPNSERAA